MVLAARRATVTFQADGDTWREQKEQRAALMVGILIGVFVLCWIPFFTAELLRPLCACDVPATWKSVFLWLGYSNSFFNPLTAPSLCHLALWAGVSWADRCSQRWLCSEPPSAGGGQEWEHSPVVLCMH